VGRAVALRLALEGFDVVCCTSSEERFNRLTRELHDMVEACIMLPHAEGGEEGRPQPGRLVRAQHVYQGVHHRRWVVGKYDTSVRYSKHIPYGASPVVFAVPCPLEGSRPDLHVINGGLLRMDTARCTHRRFHLLLPYDQVCWSCPS
ncbi:unnamed protein product, partial [Choristocarpus tenellus]